MGGGILHYFIHMMNRIHINSEVTTRGGSRISGKGVHVVGVRFADFISFS